MAKDSLSVPFPLGTTANNKGNPGANILPMGGATPSAFRNTDTNVVGPDVPKPSGNIVEGGPKNNA